MAQLKKILLVDDDDDLRDALSEQLLLTEDFDVFEAGNGADAKTRAAEALYDLVIQETLLTIIAISTFAPINNAALPLVCAISK